MMKFLPRPDLLNTAIDHAVYDRLHSWHSRIFPSENLNKSIIFHDLQSCNNWGEHLEVQVAERFFAYAGNGKRYEFTWLPIRHFVIRYYSTLLLGQFLPYAWYCRMGEVTLRTPYKNSMFLGKGMINKFKYNLWRSQQGVKFRLHFDIRSFYHSISHDILAKTLIDELCHCHPQSNVISHISKFLFPLLEYPYRKRGSSKILFCDKGLPIGNTTELFYANLFLKPLDQYLASISNITYCRKQDDIHVFSDEKSILKKVCEDLIREANKIGLQVNEKKTKIVEVSSRG